MNMNILYDNIIFDLQKAGGISVYWYELIKRLMDSDYQYGFLESNSYNNIFRKILDISKDKIILEKNIPKNIRRYINIRIDTNGYNIFHSSYYRVCKMKNIKNIVTVHDFTYEYFVKGLPKTIHHIQKKHAIDNADGIICVSENTKKDLLKFFPYIEEDKIKVIYNGVSNEFYPLENKNDEKYYFYKDRKYILFVGNRSGYKNFDIVIDILYNLKEYELFIVGGGVLDDLEKDILDNRLGRNRYTHIQGSSTEELSIIYNFAHCLIYPSSYEGFGIPVIEAMKCGCPVVALNKSSIPEVAGNAAILVDKLNLNSFLDEILKLEDINNREKVITKGYIQASKFSWDRTYYETIEFYDYINYM